MTDTIRDLMDILAIQRLKAVYAKCADEKYTDDHQRKPQDEVDRIAWEQAAVFTEDATWDGGAFGVLQGRQAIYDNLRLGPWKFTLHHYLSPLIDLDGDRAHGRWMLWQVGTLTQDDTPILLTGVTDDDYVRTPDGWRMARMVQTLKFMTHVHTPWTLHRNAPFVVQAAGRSS
jgi:hypothetical protein